MNDAEIKSVIDGLDEITGYSCEQMSLFDNDVFIRKTAEDAMSAIRELKAENERLRQEKDDAVKRITEEQRYEASEMDKCGSDGDDWGYGIHVGKYTAYQFALDIINKPPKEGEA